MAGDDDPRLDALLREAAPGGAPAGFASRVLAAGRSRRRERRLRRIALAAAAAVLVIPPLVGITIEPLRRPAVVLPAQETSAVVGAVPEQASPGGGSYAALLPSAGDARHQVMMGRVNGRVLLAVRPAGGLEEAARPPMAMVGLVSQGGDSGSMAVLFR